MTSIIVWKNIENVENPSIWIVGDTKMTNNNQLLSNEGCKIMQLTLKVKDITTVYQETYYENTLGFAFAGSSFIAYNIYNVLNHLLSNIGGLKNNNHLPTLESIAIKAEKLLGFYKQTVQSNCELIICGKCPVQKELQVYKIVLELKDNIFEAKSYRIGLDKPSLIMLGDHKDEISDEIIKIAKDLDSVKNRKHTRAPIIALKKIIKEKKFETIGGNLQLGILNPLPFGNFETISVWDNNTIGKATYYHNNIDLIEIIGDNVDDCRLGIKGMIID